MRRAHGMDQTHKHPSDWWEKQLTPLTLEFARESVSLSDPGI